MQSRPVVFVFHDVPDRALFEDCFGEITESRRIVALDTIARQRPAGTCAITFDDGRRSVVDVAHPVLAAAKVPYTIFVCTEVLKGGPAPWFIRVEHLVRKIGIEPLRTEWRLGRDYVRTAQELTTVLKEIPLDGILAGLAELEREHDVPALTPQALFMTAAQAGELAAAGAAFGAHTCRHAILSKLSTAVADVLDRATGLLVRRTRPTPVTVEQLTTATLMIERSAVMRRLRLVPNYDAEFLDWLLAELDAFTFGAELRARWRGRRLARTPRAAATRAGGPAAGGVPVRRGRARPRSRSGGTRFGAVAARHADPPGGRVVDGAAPFPGGACNFGRWALRRDQKPRLHTRYGTNASSASVGSGSFRLNTASASAVVSDRR
jgi:peptidoglycan/xylan/chitin deacetylase (PgdA/CDA1 family)